MSSEKKFNIKPKDRIKASRNAQEHNKEAFAEVMARVEVIDYGCVLSVTDEMMRNAAGAVEIGGSIGVPVTLFRRMILKYGVRMSIHAGTGNWILGRFGTDDELRAIISDRVSFDEEGTLLLDAPRAEFHSEITRSNPTYGMFS